MESVWRCEGRGWDRVSQGHGRHGSGVVIHLRSIAMCALHIRTRIVKRRWIIDLHLVGTAIDTQRPTKNVALVRAKEIGDAVSTLVRHAVGMLLSVRVYHRVREHEAVCFIPNSLDVTYE